MNMDTDKGNFSLPHPKIEVKYKGDSFWLKMYNKNTGQLPKRLLPKDMVLRVSVVLKEILVIWG